MNLFKNALILCLFTFCLGVGCKTKTPTETDPAPEVKAEKPEPQKEVKAQKAHPDCVGPIATGKPESIKIGNKEWELNGSTLTQKSQPKNDTLVIGTLTDIKEDTPENIANLKKFLKWYKKEKVDMIVVAGDTGFNKNQIMKSLSTIAELKIPVFNIIGNREGKKEYKEAMKMIREKHKNVFDLNSIRRVDTKLVDIISMPGYHNENYVHSEDGCPYYAADIAELEQIVKSCDSPQLVVSHGGPQQKGKESIVRTTEGINDGDPKMAEFIKKHKIPFGVFGNFHEAGGRATDLDGTKILKQNKLHPNLFLNPGPADSVRWLMNDKTESMGMAGIMTIKKDQASYKIKRVKGSS